MAIEQKTVTVNGEDYLITQFGARAGFKLSKKVAKVVLPVMSKFYGGAEASYADVMDAIVDKIDELDDETIALLLSRTTYQKKEINFDEHFAGNYGTLILLIWEIIKFNFDDVFSVITGDTNE